MKVLAVASAPFLLVSLVVGLIVTGPASTLQPQSLCIPRQVELSTDADLDREQLANAAAIIRIGKSSKVPAYGWVIAIAAAMQESSLRNLLNGDRDSAGLFQMRPSMGWGTFEQVTDPEYAIRAFYGGSDVPPANPGLLDIEGWQQMDVAEAAQTIERSAHPDAYARWTPTATAIVEEIGGTGLKCQEPSTVSCQPSHRSVEAGLTSDAQLVVRCAVAQFAIENIGGRSATGHIEGSDHYTGRAVDLMIDGWLTPAAAAFGDSVATYFVNNAESFGITHIIWRGRIWSTGQPTWRTYSHPDGRTDPTALHMDHVHVSVSGNTATTKER